MGSPFRLIEFDIQNCVSITEFHLGESTPTLVVPHAKVPGTRDEVKRVDARTVHLHLVENVTGRIVELDHRVRRRR
jgi:hypothetical protein